MPDHPGLVQTFLWQELDRWNDDPRLTFPVCGSFATGGTQTWMDRSCRCGSVLHRWSQQENYATSMQSCAWT